MLQMDGLGAHRVEYFQHIHGEQGEHGEHGSSFELHAWLQIVDTGWIRASGRCSFSLKIISVRQSWILLPPIFCPCMDRVLGQVVQLNQCGYLLVTQESPTLFLTMMIQSSVTISSDGSQGTEQGEAIKTYGLLDQEQRLTE